METKLEEILVSCRAERDTLAFQLSTWPYVICLASNQCLTKFHWSNLFHIFRLLFLPDLQWIGRHHLFSPIAECSLLRIAALALAMVYRSYTDSQVWSFLQPWGEMDKCVRRSSKGTIGGLSLRAHPSNPFSRRVGLGSKFFKFYPLSTRCTKGVSFFPSRMRSMIVACCSKRLLLAMCWHLVCKVVWHGGNMLEEPGIPRELCKGL